MILRGIVSSIEASDVRVIVPERNNSVTGLLKVASHITLLNVGDNVIFTIFSDNMKDGVVISKY